MTTFRFDSPAAALVPSSDPLDAARRAIVEQMAPLTLVFQDLVKRWRLGIDLVAARRRVAAGLTAFDPMEIVGSAGDMVVPFLRAAKALERAGLAANGHLAHVVEQRFEVLPLAIEWIAGAPAPREPHLRTARRAAALVAGSALHRAANEVGSGLPLEQWTRSTCPCCGGQADIAVSAPSGRRLVCARCDTSWSTALQGCLGCGADAPPLFAWLTAPIDGYRLAVCNACGRYLKERDAGAAELHPQVERVLTAELDGAAERRGLRA